MKHFTINLFVTGLLGTGLGSAQTPVAEQIKFVLTQDLVRRSTENGKPIEVIVPSPRAVMPGDLLREETTLTNVSGKALGSFQVTVPVPTGTEFAGSASLNPARWKLTYSADSGKTYSETPTRTVTVSENGKTVTKKVTADPSQYTHVRWVVASLKKDESLKLSFRVKVK